MLGKNMFLDDANLIVMIACARTEVLQLCTAQFTGPDLPILFLQRRVQSQILRRIEDIGLTVAEQMRPTETGYKAVKLSSGKVGEENKDKPFLKKICLFYYLRNI